MTQSKMTAEVPEELGGKRLDQVLSILYPQHSRTRLQSWIKTGNVKVDNKIFRQKDAVHAGACIEITPVYEVQQKDSAEDIPLDIVHEDDEILMLNKPHGLVVHPGAGNPNNTLLNALLFHDPALEKLPRAGIVQRLDKDTSGMMVVAKTPSCHTYLVDQLQQRLISREYRAIVNGVMTAGGTIDAPIGRHSVNRKHMAVAQHGKTATTHYRIIKKYAAHTYIQLKLETGRTHQIRVHLAHIHYPIVGDSSYGGRRRLPKNASSLLRDTLNGFPRQALHAYSLGLAHPKTGEYLTRSAPIPDDMQQLLDVLDNESRG